MRIALQPLGVLLALATGELAAQSLHYGSACSGLLPAPTISFSGSVVPGQQAHVRLAGAPPGALVALNFGVAPAAVDVSTVDGVQDGCQLLVAPSSILVLNANALGTLDLSFKCPSSLGSDLYFQWAVVESVSPLSITLTQGLRVTVQTSPFLHVVIEAPTLLADYEGDGVEGALLDGSGSHTHEIGHDLTAHDWYLDGALVATTPVASVSVPLGAHELALHISDDNTPAHSLMSTTTITVVPADEIPGISARYHDSGAADPATLLDAVPATAEWAETLPGFLVTGGASLGGSPFDDHVLAVLRGDVELGRGTYTFSASGGSDRRLFVDGASVTGPLVLGAGAHGVEARFAVSSLAQAPLEVKLAVGAGAPAPIAAGLLTHDAGATGPVLNALVPATGTTAGGTSVVLQGAGFFPAGAVEVHWGGAVLTTSDGLAIQADAIAFDAPVHASGPLSVSVETPQGTSNVRTFTYVDTGPVPTFQLVSATTVQFPTAADWGPDGRLYAVNIDGELIVLTYDDAYGGASVQTYPGVSGLTNKNALGLAFNPYDPPSPVKLYVSHGLLYADGGGVISGSSSYYGQVSVLTGPDFDDPQPLVTGLPQSNSGHASNGLQFDNNGDLLLLQGCNTNAGIPAAAMGTLPESPLAGALLVAETSRPDFEGEVHYVETAGGAPNDDQVDGSSVDVAPGSHVRVRAPGLRNPYDLVFTTTGRTYATDNGPNLTFGPSSTSATTQSALDAAAPDELLLVEAGNYYGSPNRNRGRTDDRQNVYRDPYVPSLPEAFTQTLTILPSSSDGLAEYRADTFGGQMRGWLLVQEWNDGARRVQLAPDGRSVLASVLLEPALGALDIQGAPGGAIVLADHTHSSVRVLAPVESGSGVAVADIHPWRATPAGGVPFIIGGRNFGPLAGTSVTVGELSASVTSTSSTRIRGVLPVQPSPTTELLDVVVTTAGQSDTLTDAFRFLFPTPGLEPGRWEDGLDLPLPLGEVAGGVIDGVLYLVGEGSPATCALDLMSGGWTTSLAVRPFVGHHHSAEVVAGRLYLFGGLAGGSNGRVQIYDPDADLWAEGAPLPWGGGSLGTALIAGKVYAAGGIVGSATVANCAVYDPVANSWTSKALMPAGRNHAAATTDGSRFWVFGGRIGGNTVSNGFDDVQVYDPATNTWDWDKNAASELVPLPIGRGGTGRAVAWDGELYVLGGETSSGPGATPLKVYDRVDVYDPATHTWRLDAPMTTARHGIFPLLFQGRLFVIGGGIKNGNSQSVIAEVFSPP